MKTFVWATTQIESWHRWVDAPEQYAYLRNSHRHMFHVKVELSVDGLDREVEFIDLKHRVGKWCEDLQSTSEFASGTSCEHMARYVLDAVDEYYGPDRGIIVTVSEDGENGATVIK